MSIESNKLVNLADAQVLYNDLRDRESDLKSAFVENREDVFDEIVYADDAPIPAEWEYGNIGSSGENANEDRHYYARTKTAFVPEKTIKIDIRKVLASGLTNYVVVEYNASTHAMTNRTVYQAGTYPNIVIDAEVGKEYRLCLMCSSSITIDLNNMDLYATVTTETEIQKNKTGLSEALNVLDVEETLLRSEIPGTTVVVTFDANGNPATITHSADGSTVRTDVFTWGTGTVTEVRTASSKQITITTNLTTLAQTVSEIEEVA